MSSFKTENNENSFSNIVKYEYLVAGISAGIVSTLAVHPLDVIKIRFEVHDGRTQHIPKYRGIYNAFVTILKHEGFRGLYSGSVPNIVGAGSSWGLYFLIYNGLKIYEQQGNVNKPLTAYHHLTKATEAGIITLLLTNPIWVCKTRLCLQQTGMKSDIQYKGMWDCLIKLYKYEGIRGYYKGFSAGIFGASHGAVQFMIYDGMKNFYCEKKNLPITSKLGVGEYLFFSSVSKLAAAATTYPYQVVRARMQNQFVKYNGVWDCVKDAWTHEGYRGFYKGLGTNLVRVVPASMITFVTYENIVHFLMDKK